jgi:hypothetical protein
MTKQKQFILVQTTKNNKQHKAQKSLQQKKNGEKVLHNIIILIWLVDLPLRLPKEICYVKQFSKLKYNCV